LSDISLKVYGDYGFSPDILFSKIPFKVNIANETFDIKAELFDKNSTLVYSDLRTLQTFDPYGESLYVYVPGYSNIDPTKIEKISGSLSISQSLFLPNLNNCPPENIRLVGWKLPLNYPANDTDGGLCYTNISSLKIERGDYISLSTIDAGLENTVTSLAIKYDGANGFGRKIVILTGSLYSGGWLKTTYQ